jgi:hypothetical protein
MKTQTLDTRVAGNFIPLRVEASHRTVAEAVLEAGGS